MTSWHVIETLAPDGASVVWTRGRRVPFQKVQRLVNSVGIDPSPYIASTRTTGVGVDEVTHTHKGEPRRVITVPSPGLDGAVHAVSLWVDAPDVDPDTPPILGSMAVDLTTNRIASTADCYRMSSVSMDGYASDRDPGMFLHKVTNFEQVSELVNMIVTPTIDASFRGTLTVKHDDGRLMNWQGVAKFDLPANLLRGVAQDVTAYEPPQVSSAELARMQLGSVSARSAAALLGFPADGKSAPALCYWLTPTPAALTNADMSYSWQFDADSIEALWKVQRLLAGSVNPATALSATVRIRTPSSDWLDCSVMCSKHPADNIGANILVTQVTVL
jgi:hypothetical protein